MDSRPLKRYHIHGMDSRDFLKCYCDAESGFIEETLVFIMEKLHNAMAGGQIKGKTLTDISIGAIIQQLYTVSEYFEEITILKLNETCSMELRKWLNVRTGAFDWTHASSIVTEIEGTSYEELKKEENLKEKIKNIVPFDLARENLTDPIMVPPADCLVTAWLLEMISHDQNDYVQNLRKFAKLLKPGGNLILVGCFNATYYTAGKDRLHILTYDESFLRKTLANEGFTVVSCDILDRKVKSDLTDYKQFVVLTAVKGNI